VQLLSDDARHVKKQKMSHYEKTLLSDLLVRTHRSNIITIDRI